MAYKITVQQIMRAYPQTNRQRCEEFVAVFNEWCEKFGINTPLRVAHFCAQIFHESGCLKRFEENLNYSAERLLVVFPKYFNKGNVEYYARNPQKIGNRVYANRMGNGSEGSGDGYRYRGRGALQLTGRANYQAYQNSGFCVGDLMSHPEWLTQKPGAYKSAMWFWWKNGLSALADKDDINAITKRINGGYNGLSERRIYVAAFKKVFK